MQAGDSARMVDVLAQASISTNTSLDMMGKALQGAAPAASAFGYSVEDTAMAVGMMSDAGIQGEAAGETLKNLMTHLSEPTKLVQNYMDQLSVSLKDSSGDEAVWYYSFRTKIRFFGIIRCTKRGICFEAGG
jgi:TP901 family phage tail tape measure protein